MAIGVNWKEIWADVWAPVWQNTPPVEVPDVVGQSQASGTAELEAEGFVVAVATAYSSTVPAGDIISQLPTAGTLALNGSTVTITVSLGEEPVQEGRAPAGGYDIYRKPSRADEERDEDKRRLRELIEAAVRGEKPVLKAVEAVIEAPAAIVAELPKTGTEALLAKAQDTRKARKRLDELEAKLAQAERLHRIRQDDDRLLELLGASGLLQ